MRYFTLSTITAMSVRAIDTQVCLKESHFTVLARPLQNWIINTTGQPLPSWGCTATQIVTALFFSGLLVASGYFGLWLDKILRPYAIEKIALFLFGFLFVAILVCAFLNIGT